MMAQPVPHQQDKKRVKVYELRNNDWFDRGTGFCTACFVTIQDDHKEPRVIVQSEDQPDRLLLETKIVKDDGFQKQQDTLIVWTDNGVDMALSFQEADGCQAIWKFIDSVQQQFQAAMGGPDDGLSDDLAMDMPAAIQLPPAELGALIDIENTLRNLSQSPSGRDALAKAIMSEDYIAKLIPLVEMAEDLESLGDLHHLCNIMKTVVLLNDTGLIEHAVSDECVLGVVGAMEYDPDFPTHKANHRQWLNNQGRYKEVVRIQDDQVRRKIHQTYRLQYLKDVVLARILDDPTFSVLNSLIFFNQVEIVQHLHMTPGFMTDLFAVFVDPNEQPLRKKEAVLFIQQMCAISKNLQPPARQGLYGNFLQQGLLPVINFGLRHPDVSVRVGATDILGSILEFDPSMIRKTIYEQIQRKTPPLTDSLIDLLLVEVDLGIKSQLTESLKVLLDPTGPGGPQPDNRDGFKGRQPGGPDPNPQHQLFLQHFYEHAAHKLFKPLLDLEKRPNMKFNALEDGIFGYLNEILCFYIRHHGGLSKLFVLRNNIAKRFGQLLTCKQKHLQLVAIRFFRHLVLFRDPYYIKDLQDSRVFGPVLDTLLRTLPRDNLLSSACLDFFTSINYEGDRDLAKHIMENYREKIVALSHIDYFRGMLMRYDQSQGYTISEPDEEEEQQMVRRTAHNAAGRGMMEHLTVDQAQEEYWNTSDDDEENHHHHHHHHHHHPAAGHLASNGTPSKPLVEYTSDEEEDGSGDAVMTTPVDDEAAKENQKPPPSTPPAVVVTGGPPPERLSEKRRREEDEDDDALDKLLVHKRRNSSSAGSNSTLSAGLLRKKQQGFGSGGGGKSRSREGSPSPNGAGQKKIAISIAPVLKTSVVKGLSPEGVEEEAAGAAAGK
ncbi:component of IIS longevity pathway SMK-1-domain-containing protein [Triangularia verruculosa]|uniref:Component of IIS longevity pathway SMK-1-domain-containing protein n=1 Tax=Triangularia verruculosa TaxID=2587418 RepID=A0AAN7B0Q9_9PEZI|nr:component of IIS longevity pathway SMK-1-domain-containing protein [Triangularia verruculosa]